MPTLYVIEHAGTVSKVEMPELPVYALLQERYFKGNQMEHVKLVVRAAPNLVRAHAFVDEMGPRKHLPANLKATALYQNNVRSQTGQPCYSNLDLDPGRHITHSLPLIYGRMLYWPHSAPDWEPEGSPWREHLS